MIAMVDPLTRVSRSAGDSPRPLTLAESILESFGVSGEIPGEISGSTRSEEIEYGAAELLRLLDVRDVSRVEHGERCARYIVPDVFASLRCRRRVVLADDDERRHRNLRKQCAMIHVAHRFADRKSGV